MRKRPAVLADPASLDMTPIIDIVFNLIVFFMISSELASQDLELLRLPFADQAVRTCRATPERILQVNLPTAGPAMVRGRAYSTVAGDERHAWLLDLLETESAGYDREEPDPAAPGLPASKLGVNIRADESAPFERVQRVLDACQKHGIYRTSLAAERDRP